MARLWTSGFENNAVLSADTNKEWTVGSSGQTTVTSPVNSGTYSMKLDGTQGAQQLRKTFISSNTDGPVYCRYYLRVDTLPNVNNFISTITPLAVGNDLGAILLKTDGTLELWDEDGIIGSASSALTLGTQYRIEIKVDRTAAAGSHIVEAKIDGTVFATSSTRNLSNGAARVWFGAALGLEALTSGVWYMDDIAVNDSTGSFQNTYPGPGKVIHLKPSSAGDSTEWTPDTGSNFARVQEVKPDDNTSKVDLEIQQQTLPLRLNFK
jgi:hypothetical protein